LKYTARILWKRPPYTSCYCRSSKAGGIAAFIDANTHSTEIMLKIRVDIENLIISQPDNESRH
jgi:RecA/RadA recombinase